MKTRIIWTTAILALIATAWGIAQDTPGLAGPISAALLGTNSNGKAIAITLGTNLSLAGTTLNASGGSSAGNFNSMPIWGTIGVTGSQIIPDVGGAAAGTVYATNIQAPGVSKWLMIFVETASGTGCTGGTCGYLGAFYSADLTTAECVSTVATSGGSPNINTTGWKPITWASGSAVSGGLCTYQPGWVFVQTSDSTTLGVMSSNATEQAMNAAQAVPSTKANEWGGFNASVNTGNGASLAFVTLSGLTWSVNGSRQPYFLLAHQ